MKRKAGSGPKKKPTPDETKTKPLGTGVQQSSLRVFFYSAQGTAKGFKNKGNTCYVAATLSALFSVRNVTRALRDVSPGAPSGLVTSQLAELADQFLQRCSGATGVMDVERLKNAVAVWDRTFDGSVQQDAQEFLCGLLNICDEEATKADSAQGGADVATPTREPHSIYDLFEGRYEHTLCCCACAHSWQRSERFLHISLDVGGSGLVSDMLDAAVHAPGHVECRCERCGHDLARATHRLERLPSSLLLHVKRFSYQAHGPAKAFDLVRLARTLQISTDGPAAQRPPHEAPPALPTEAEQLAWALRESQHMADDQAAQRRTGGAASRCSEYELRAVVSHIGQSAQEGHFTADGCVDGQWLRFDDSTVFPLALEKVLLDAKATSYLVVYERTDTCIGAG